MQRTRASNDGGWAARIIDSVLPLLRLAVLSFLQASAVLVHGETTHYDFKVKYSFMNPDFVEKLLITVNGEFPGPTIRVPAGNRLEVRVKNDLYTEGIVIHWHGMRQRGTPWADGAAYLTQCPILPGENYTYSFVTEQPGTFLYHGHHGMQRSAGLYGSLIVEPRTKEEEPFNYDEELNVLLSDWYHRGVIEQQAGISVMGGFQKFRWVGNPQSLLINGRGRYDCSKVGVKDSSGTVVSDYSGDELCNASAVSPIVLRVQYGKTYRLRVASASSLAIMNFLLEGHNFTIVEADGHYVEPVETSSLYIFTGQSYSVLFKATADPTRNYWAAVNMRERVNVTPAGLAILNYVPNPPSLFPPTPPPDEPAGADDDDQSLQQHRSHFAMKGTELDIPPVANRRLILLSTLGLRPDGRVAWAINNISFQLPLTPALAIYKYNFTEELSESPQPEDQYTPGFDIYNLPDNRNAKAGSRAYTFQLNDVVDVILQNSKALDPNTSDAHPWHLHGHDFWVLGYGSGEFDPAKDYDGLNYKNPPLRNTVPVFPFGWTAIRYVADNPGVWNFHCHLEAHLTLGMSVVFAAGVGHVPAIPTQALGCGRTKLILDCTELDCDPHN